MGRARCRSRQDRFEHDGRRRDEQQRRRTARLRHRRRTARLRVAFQLIPDLSPVFAGDPFPPYGLPAIATDGEHFLVVSRRITGQSPDYFAQWIASLVTLDGTMLSTVDLGPPRRMADPSAAQQATVAFDGTNYLVVTEQDNNFASTGNHMSLVATRVSAAGSLLGASNEVAPSGSTRRRWRSTVRATCSSTGAASPTTISVRSRQSSLPRPPDRPLAAAFQVTAGLVTRLARYRIRRDPLPRRLGAGQFQRSATGRLC